MVSLKVKVIKKYKVWRAGIQPFLDELVEDGYKWKEKKKEIWVYIDGEIISLGNYDWTTNQFWGGSFYKRYMNVAVKKKKMHRILAFLHITAPVSDYKKSKLNKAIGILDRAREFEPDFEYDFD